MLDLSSSHHRLATMLSTAADITPHFQERILHALSVLEKSLPRDSILPSLPAAETLDVTDIPRFCGLLTDWELEITERYDATALVEKLATRKITAIALLHAFRKRASIAHQLVCLFLVYHWKHGVCLLD